METKTYIAERGDYRVSSSGSLSIFYDNRWHKGHNKTMEERLSWAETKAHMTRIHRNNGMDYWRMAS